MPQKIIREWLAEYKTLRNEELNTYANTINQNEQLIFALQELLDQEHSHEVCSPVCHQLFDFYSSGNRQLRQFSLELIPSMISAYLVAISHNERKKCSAVESCLLGIYNLEGVDADGNPRTQTFTIPSIATPSIYHEPPSLASLTLTESALQRYHDNKPTIVKSGPLPQVESICASNRWTVLTFILSLYNADIMKASRHSHCALCTLCSRLAKTGFESLGREFTEGIRITEASSCSSSPASNRSGSSHRGVQFREELRIPVSPSLLIELLNGIYFIMFNGLAREGIAALELIHQRACYELYADVLLVTNAIMNSLRFNPSGQPNDGPMGISIALSSTQSNPAIKKDAITNASFRTKKLPDDIETQDEDEGIGPLEPPPLNPVDSDPSLKHMGPAKGFRKSSLDGLKRLASLTKPKRRESTQETSYALPQTLEEDPSSAHYKATADSHGKYRNLPVFKVQLWDDDIDAVEDEEGKEGESSDVPPAYDDLHHESDASTDAKRTSSSGIGSALKKTKPLKSIMKKSSNKVVRKESESKGRRSDNMDGHSPKHSISMSAGLSYNGDVATDPSMVKVQVVRSSSSRTIVDNLVDKVPLHGLKPSLPEEKPLINNRHSDEIVVSSQGKLMSSNHSRETKSAPLNGGNESNSSSNASLNTAL